MSAISILTLRPLTTHRGESAYNRHRRVLGRWDNKNQGRLHEKLDACRFEPGMAISAVLDFIDITMGSGSICGRKVK
jgi:hypothetical protein